MKNGRKFEAVRACLRNSVVKSNNLRAVVIHFILSAGGLISVASITALIRFLTLETESYLELSDIFLLASFVTICGGLAAYAICGYKFLKPAKENTVFSVFWLTTITSAVSILAIIHVLLWQIQKSFGVHFFSDGTVGILTVPLFFFNTVGMGVMASFGFLDHELSTIPSVLLLVAAALFPPGMLFMGLRLKTLNKDKKLTIRKV